MAEPAETKAEQPAADSPQADEVYTRGPGGRFRKGKPAASKLPSLSDRMAEFDRKNVSAPKVDGDVETESDTDEEEHEEPLAGGGEATAPNGKASGADPSKPAEPKPKRETVEAEPGKPDFAQERLAFSEWKRKQREAHEAGLRRREQEVEAAIRARVQEIDAKEKEWSPRVEKAERLLKLMESADYEGLAKEAGYDDWEKFQGHVMGTITDPNYKETRALRRELEERKAKEKADAEAKEKAEREQREHAERQQKAQQRAQAIAAHKKTLSEEMGKSSHRVIAAYSDDPMFVNTIFEIQRQNYDPSTDSTVTPEQALTIPLKGSPRTLLEELTLMRGRSEKAFAELQQKVEAAAAAATPEPKPKASKTGVVPASATVEPSGRGKWDGGAKGKAWREHARRAMEEAEEAEEQARAARGGRRR